MVNPKYGRGFPWNILNVYTPHWKSQSEMLVKICVGWGLAWPSAGKRRSSAPRAMLTKATKNLSTLESRLKLISSLSNIRYIQSQEKKKVRERNLRSPFGLNVWTHWSAAIEWSAQNKNRKLCHAMSKCLLKMCSNAIHCCTCKVTNPASRQFM